MTVPSALSNMSAGRYAGALLLAVALTACSSGSEAISPSPEGRTLAGLATRFVAASSSGVSEVLTNPLTGAAIPYTVSPRPSQWSFGDGGSAAGSSVEHVHRRVGSCTVTVTAAYEVTFTPAGGTGPQTLPDAVAVSSRTAAVTEARARLVG